MNVIVEGEPVYRVAELFRSFQGEGFHVGSPAVFVRLQGCDVGCGWCDTKDTWPEFAVIVPASDIEREPEAGVPRMALMAADAIVAYAFDWSHVVITGGEPAAQDLRPLCEALLKKSSRLVQIETSGTYAIDVPQTVWVTVSPKIGMAGGREILGDVLARADEIKFPVGKQRDIDLLLSDVLPFVTREIPIYLQPLSQSKAATALCLVAAKNYGWRVSFQVHKYTEYR